ncbi:MAG: hypothetical protein SWQ30_23300 [Thermodesulfobacteriota bacterium]|nr:hypothetical protein [Thermodesulfobacteriota bacterium]
MDTAVDMAQAGTYVDCLDTTSDITGGHLDISSGCLIGGHIDTSNGTVSIETGAIVDGVALVLRKSPD